MMHIDFAGNSRVHADVQATVSTFQANNEAIEQLKQTLKECYLPDSQSALAFYPKLDKLINTLDEYKNQLSSLDNAAHQALGMGGDFTRVENAVTANFESIVI